MKKVYKYGTGQEVPKGAVYLCTKVQREVKGEDLGERRVDMWFKCWLVWHYFLVEEKI